MPSELSGRLARVLFPECFKDSHENAVLRGEWGEDPQAWALARVDEGLAALKSDPSGLGEVNDVAEVNDE
jgi:hypothetical protein